MAVKQRLTSLAGLDPATARLYDVEGDGFAINFDRYSAEMERRYDSLATDLDVIQLVTTAREMAREIATPGSAEALVPHIASRLRGIEKNGTRALAVVDAARRPTTLTMEDLKSEIRRNPDFTQFIDSSAPSERRPDHQRGNSSLTRSAFDEMGPRERSAYVLSGGRIVDDQPPVKKAQSLPPGTLSRGAFDALDAKARANYFQSGGKVGDE